MKLKEFNKFSGTEFRVKNVLAGYYQIIMWLFRTTNGKKFKVHDFQSLFINYCKQENIYSYKKNEKIDRFNFIVLALKKLGFLIEHKGEYKFKENINENYLEYSNPVSLFFETIQNSENFNVFSEMLNFVYKTNGVDVLPLYMAFSTWEPGDNFKELYKIFASLKDPVDCCVYIASIITKLNLENFRQYKTNFNYRKPSPVAELSKLIVENKEKNVKIDSTLLQKYFSVAKVKKFLKLFNHEKKNNYDLQLIADNINKMSIENFISKLEFFKIYDLLFVEYFDLWIRWMRGFGFVISKDDTNIVKGLLIKDSENEIFKINLKDYKIEKYPYSIDFINYILQEISKDDFNDKKMTILKDYEGLKDILSSTLAEYFVNLKYAYLLNIRPSDFQAYSNTKVYPNLEPIHTAPGGMADFSFYDKEDKILINVETTLLKNYSMLFKNEIESNTRHLSQTAIKKEKEGIKYTNLIIVTPSLEKHVFENFTTILKFEFNTVWKDKLPKSISKNLLESKNFFEISEANSYDKME